MMLPKPIQEDEKPPLRSALTSGSESDGVGTAAVIVIVPLPPPPSPLPKRPATHDLSTIPDGGLDAWLQVLGSFVILSNTWGLVNTFGVYQTWYEKHFRGTSSSDISWVGSLQGSILMLSGLVSGPLYDAGYFRHLIWAGCFLIVLGQFMTSLATAYWQVLLSQGICIGVGCGLAFLPATGILSQYFRRRKSIALGIASAGSPIAGMVFPVVFTRVEERLGFGWATRVIAFLLLGFSVVPLATMRTRLPPSDDRKRAPVDREAFGDAPFMAYMGSGFLLFLGLYVAFFYIQLFGVSHEMATAADHNGFDNNPGTNNFDSSYLVTFLNAGSILGRLLPNYLADRLGALNVFGVTALASAVSVFAWMGIRTLGPLCAFAVLYGAFSGGIVSLMPSVVVGLSPDLGRVGARMGMVCAAAGVGILVGPPAAGAIVGDHHSDREWHAMIGYVAAILMGGSLLCLASRVLMFRRTRELWY